MTKMNTTAVKTTATVNATKTEAPKAQTVKKVESKIEKFTSALSKFVSANAITEVESAVEGERMWTAQADLGTGLHNYTFKLKTETTKTGKERQIRQVFVDDAKKPIEFAIAKKKMYTIFDRLVDGKAGNALKKSVYDADRVKAIAADIAKNKANYKVTETGFEGVMGEKKDKIAFITSKKTDKSGREITLRALKMNGVVIAEGCKLARFGEIMTKNTKKVKADLSAQAELDVEGLI